MQEILKALEAAAAGCDAAAATFRSVLSPIWDRLKVVTREVDRAWSGSTLGYHANTFISGLEPARTDEVWDPTYGRVGAFSSRTHGRWETFDPEDLHDEILRRAGVTKENLDQVNAATDVACAAFVRLREEVRPIVDALIASQAGDTSLQRAQETIMGLTGQTNDQVAMLSQLPKSFATADQLALRQGAMLPVHQQIKTRFAMRLGVAGELETLGRECRYVRNYLQNKERFAKAFPSASSSPTATRSECAVLLFAANPDSSDRLALDEEVRGIETKLRASEHRDRISFRHHWATRPDDLLQAMNETKPTVVHFSGHGNARAILLHDGQGGGHAVQAMALTKLFGATAEPVRVVVLCSCYSDGQAQALLEAVDCVVGMNDSVDDETARTFSASFYGALGFGLSVQAAYDQGCAAIALLNLTGEDTPTLQARGGVDPASLVLVDGE